jgi:hypothetical protein
VSELLTTTEIEARLKRLRAFAEEPSRKPMSRTHRWPTMVAKHIANEQEIVALRSALREALALVDALR